MDRLYFAYGMNMNPSHMGELVPRAERFGMGVLDGWEFAIARHGYANVERRGGCCVFGVLWRLGREEEAVLDAFEGVECGLYAKQELPVRFGHAGEVRSCLVYVSAAEGGGRPEPGYLNTVLEGAECSGLPEPYVERLRKFGGRGTV